MKLTQNLVAVFVSDPECAIWASQMQEAELVGQWMAVVGHTQLKVKFL